MGTDLRTRKVVSGSGVKTSVWYSETPPITTTAGVTSLVEQTITVETPAAAGATTITVTGVTAGVPKGNWLLFIDPNGLEYRAKVTEDSAAADTSLTVAKLEFPLPAGAIAKTPTELLDRTESPWESSADISEFTTYNTGGGKIKKAMSISDSFSANGLYITPNAGLDFVEEFYNAKREFWWIVELPAEERYLRGRIMLGLALAESFNMSITAEGEVNAEIGGQISGTKIIIPAVPEA